MLSGGIAGSYGRSVSSFYRTLILASVVTAPFFPYQQWISVPPLQSCQHLLSFLFLMIAILTEMIQNLKVAIIFIFLMVKAVEDILKYLSPIYISSSSRILFSSML